MKGELRMNLLPSRTKLPISINDRKRGYRRRLNGAVGNLAVKVVKNIPPPEVTVNLPDVNVNTNVGLINANAALPGRKRRTAGEDEYVLTCLRRLMHGS